MPGGARYDARDPVSSSIPSDSPASETFSHPLLAWFRGRKRDLPWRRKEGLAAPCAAYRTWISEVMLQQTVVAAVVPRFEKWMRRFPDASALAAANERAVLREWEGLGYYSRARNLYRAAKLLVERHGGEIPATLPELRALPGVGEYTAAAVLSIAFGRPEPVLDANVRRVMSRVLCLRTWNRAAEAKTRGALRRLIPERAPGDFNEAMMELGALICRPTRPDCAACPIARCCEARRRGLETAIPSRRKSVSVKRVTPLGVTVHEDRVLIRRRGKDEIGAGLWGFPALDGSPPARAISLPPVIHAYTKYRDELRPSLVRTTKPKRKDENEKWVRWSDIERYPFPSVYRKIIASARRALTDISPPK
jgi:A/G-specific adenine glycosylase